MDEKFMQLALEQAKIAATLGEIPIGAVVVKGGEVISCAHNMRNQSKNAVEHAEILAISDACKKLGDWRLLGCDLYVTLEPCMMCLGACFNARLSNVYFGAYDTSGNGCLPVAETLQRTLNHELFLQGGILQRECSQVLSDFFKTKRD